MTDIEEYFGDKVDWKFYNYLLDKATEFEDVGCTLHIIIGINTSINNIFPKLYSYATGYDLRSSQIKKTDTHFQHYVIQYEKHGIFFEVEFSQNDSTPPGILHDKLWNKIKDKCYKLYTDDILRGCYGKKDYPLKIKPKYS